MVIKIGQRLSRETWLLTRNLLAIFPSLHLHRALEAKKAFGSHFARFKALDIPSSARFSELLENPSFLESLDQAGLRLYCINNDTPLVAEKSLTVRIGDQLETLQNRQRRSLIVSSASFYDFDGSKVVSIEKEENLQYKLPQDSPGHGQLHLCGMFVGKHPGITRALDIAKTAANLIVPVMITGATGTGKEHIARIIHHNGPRRDENFIAVNCAAFAAELLESELFGHERGSFTGANHAHAGIFEIASAGTLFLDEIGDMPLATQVKLLRVLQDGTFTRVGSTKTMQSKTRIIVATHKDLKDEIRMGRFRQDLYYRIAVLEIRLPPLSDRHKDLLPLANFLLAVAMAKTGIRKRGFAKDAEEALLAYSWPGNIREMQNAIERAVVLSSEDKITAADLAIDANTLLGETMERITLAVVASDDDEKPAPQTELFVPSVIDKLLSSGLSLNQLIRALRTSAIKEALLRTGGNQSAAAKMLGLRRNQLRKSSSNSARKE